MLMEAMMEDAIMMEAMMVDAIMMEAMDLMHQLWLKFILTR